jgi:hypothetical protein
MRRRESGQNAEEEVVRSEDGIEGGLRQRMVYLDDGEDGGRSESDMAMSVENGEADVRGARSTRNCCRGWAEGRSGKEERKSK